MNICIMMVLISLVWGSSALCAAPVQELAAMKVYFVQQTLQPPVLDGKLDDPAWQNAQAIDDFGHAGYHHQDKTIKIPRTEARFLWDDKFLYIGLKAFEPDIAKCKQIVANPGTAVFWKDLFEVHIDTKHNRKTRYQLMLNPAGEKSSSNVSIDTGWSLERDFTWPLTADFTLVGNYGQDFWTIEAKVAFADLEVLHPHVGMHMGLNVARFRFVEGTQFLCWTCQGSSHHDLKQFADMIYVGPEKMSNVLEGLEKAYPDVKSRKVILIMPEGYKVIDHGKESLLTFEQAVSARADEVKGDIQKVRSVLPEKTDNKDVRTIIKGCDNYLKSIDRFVADAKTNGAITYVTSQQAIEKINKVGEQSKSVEWQYKAVELFGGK